MVLPKPEFYPDAFNDSEEAARQLFVRTCGYMQINPESLDLQFYRPNHRVSFTQRLIKPALGWAGLYQPGDDKQTIQIAASHLGDAAGLVSTMAHELAHVRLLGEGRLTAAAHDHEYVTDLATVFFGLGIFGANCCYRQTVSYGVHKSQWSGYLDVPQWGYALALYARLRNDLRPSWLKLLDRSVRTCCEDTMACLIKSGGPQIATQPEFKEIDRATWDELAANSKTNKRPTIRTDHLPEPDAPDETTQPYVAEVEDLYLEGTVLLQGGHFEQAAEKFSVILQQNPNDSDSLQQRAWAYLELHRFDESLSDARHAVQLDPKNSDGYLVRGIAALQMKKHDRAISGFNRYLKEEDVAGTDGTRMSRTYYYRGLAYAGSNEFEMALDDYNMAIRRFPDWAEPYEARAQVYDALGRPAKATADRAEATRRATSFTNFVSWS